MTDPAPRSHDFAVLLDGELTLTPRLAAQIDGARIIAADGGMRHAETLGVMPELWVGDFDSASQALIDAYDHVPRLQVPARKAISDGELAISRARDLGARSILVCGALGGSRTDHAFYHLLLASRIAESWNVSITLTSGREEALPILPGHTLTPHWPDGTVFSVIPVSELTGLDISDADWPLTETYVELGSSLTLSNIARNSLAVRVESGRALLLAQVAD